MGKIRLPEENDEFLYFTQRSIYRRGDERKKTYGTTKHKARVWVFKDEPETANIEYTCPYCDHKGSGQDKWVKPFKFSCEKCGKKIRIPKLK